MEDIGIHKIENFEVGFKRLKNSALENTGGEKIYEYSHASFGISTLSYKEVRPCSLYALRENLRFQKLLRQQLLSRYGINLFSLPGIIYLHVRGQIIGLAPPFIEIYVETNGEQITTLQDGIHRFILAKQMGVSQKCVVVHNLKSDRKYLPYSYPNFWSDVKLYDHPPVNKKNYRRIPHYSFMQPLKGIFDSSIANKIEYGR